MFKEIYLFINQNAVTLALSIVLWGFADVFTALKDLSSEGYWKMPYLDKNKGWKFKYKLDKNRNLIPLNKKPWYYFFLKAPKAKEKFPFSTTLLVWMTDGWHLFKMISSLLERLSIVIVWKANLLISTFLFIVYTIAEWQGFYIYKVKKWKTEK